MVSLHPPNGVCPRLLSVIMSAKEILNKVPLQRRGAGRCSFLFLLETPVSGIWVDHDLTDSLIRLFGLLDLKICL